MQIKNLTEVQISLLISHLEISFKNAIDNNYLIIAESFYKKIIQYINAKYTALDPPSMVLIELVDNMAIQYATSSDNIEILTDKQMLKLMQTGVSP